VCFCGGEAGGRGAENKLLAKLSAKLSNFNSTDETEDGFL